LYVSSINSSGMAYYERVFFSVSCFRGQNCVTAQGEETEAEAEEEVEVPQCGENQVWDDYSNLDICNLCSYLFRSNDCRPPRGPLPGCRCLPGYRRDSQNNCILESDCKPNCPVNQLYSPCGGLCGPTCEIPSPNCSQSCYKGCGCAKGFVRNINNVCAPKKECSLCKKDEVYTQCGAKCEPSCDQRNPICPKSCDKGCVCRGQGYVRRNGKCVPLSECPSKNCF
jgi:hypothetical protein